MIEYKSNPLAASPEYLSLPHPQIPKSSHTSPTPTASCISNQIHIPWRVAHISTLKCGTHRELLLRLCRMQRLRMAFMRLNADFDGFAVRQRQLPLLRFHRLVGPHDALHQHVAHYVALFEAAEVDALDTVED